MTSIAAGQSDAAQPMEEEKNLTVLGHLEEVRGRLFKSIIAVVICIIICFPLARYIYPILMNPLPGIELYYTEVTGLLASYMKLALYGGLILAWPYLLYQFVMFLKPALTHKEKGYFYTLLPGVLILFVAGIMFGYFVLLPPALNFLYYSFPSYVGGDIEPIWTVDSYTSVVSRLLFWLGVVFQIPILMYFLARIGIVSPGWIRRKWRYAVVLAFIIGGVITPTFDPINQSLVAGPIILLYGLGYLLAKLAWIGRNVFGVGKLPQTLGSLGKGVRSFRKSAAGEEDDDGDHKALLESKAKKEESVKEKDTADEEKS